MKDKVIDAVTGLLLFAGFLWLYAVASHADLVASGM
jgi:hypothetical protein